MQPKETPDAKISKTKKNTNKRKAMDVPGIDKKIDVSLLKKNEFALILFGALLLTIIIFFLFFRSSGTKNEPVSVNASTTSFADLENRMGKMEEAFQLQQGSAQPPAGKLSKELQNLDSLKDRVARLETAFAVKFDSLTEKIKDMEKSISQLKANPSATVAPKAKSEPKPQAVVPVKKAMKKEKQVAVSHTVQKGETLYSISKKYNTSIEALQKLNKLTPDSKIYPGSNILIR